MAGNKTLTVQGVEIHLVSKDDAAVKKLDNAPLLNSKEQGYLAYIFFNDRPPFMAVLLFWAVMFNKRKKIDTY